MDNLLQVLPDNILVTWKTEMETRRSAEEIGGCWDESEESQVSFSISLSVEFRVLY